MPISRAEAAAELLKRRQARRTLIDFTSYSFRKYNAEPAHHLMAVALDSVAGRVTKKIIIVAPPQHGKSELTSVRLPAFWLGKNPELPVILSSYGSGLAASKSKQCREIVESEEYKCLFPNSYTRDDSRAADNWSLAGHKGGMLAAGVGGAITGHGAALGIIDDPFENWEQAQSKNQRDKVWDWYRSTFRTRIWEGGSIVIIMTRWHEDDLIGRILKNQADEWTVLRLPAVCESQEVRDRNNADYSIRAGLPDPLGRREGDPLCPARYSKETLDSLKNDVGSVVWDSEYQGAPKPASGNQFKREWFKFVNAAPIKVDKRIRSWDKAASEADGACETAGVLMSRTSEGQITVEDVVHDRVSSYGRDNLMLNTAELDGIKYSVTGLEIWHEREPGSGGLDSARATNRLLGRWPVHDLAPTGDKDVRMEPYRAQCEAGNVYLVRGPWNEAYINQLCAIPNGTYRDMGDASSQAYNKLALGSISAIMNFYKAKAEQKKAPAILQEMKEDRAKSAQEERWRVVSNV